MENKTSLVFFGASEFVLPVIEKLKTKYTVSLVVTTEQKTTDKRYEEKMNAVLLYCEKNAIPTLSVTAFDDEVLQKIRETGAPVGILAYFGMIVPPELLELFPKGILNIHPSLLPAYRGPTPVQTAILNGNITTGVSIIKLDEEVDHGPILIQKEAGILNNDTSISLYEKLFPLGADLILEKLDDYINGTVDLMEQEHAEATYTKHLTKESGHIDLENPPSQPTFDRMVRAYVPWPNVWTHWNNKIIKFYPNKKIQIEGKKIVDLQTFVQGYPELKQKLALLFERENLE